MKKFHRKGKPAKCVETLPEDDPIAGFDFEEADDALEPLHVGGDVEVVQQFVVVKILNLSKWKSNNFCKALNYFYTPLP